MLQHTSACWLKYIAVVAVRCIIMAARQRMAHEPHERGGLRQRMARQRARHVTGVYPSKLVDHLLELTAWKHISPQLVQKVCELARHDAVVLASAIVADVAESGEVPDADTLTSRLDIIMPTLHHAASVGSFGRHHQNVNRSLSLLTQQRRFNGITRVSLPVKPPGCPMARHVPHELLLPHRTLAEMFHRFHASFVARICPSPTRLAEFWRSMRRHPNTAHLNHLFRDIPNWYICVDKLG